MVANPSALNVNNPGFTIRGGKGEEDQNQNRKKFNLYGFNKLVLGYVSNKYRREMDRIEKYLDRLENGDDLAFKDLIIKRKGEDGSDMSQ